MGVRVVFMFLLHIISRISSSPNYTFCEGYVCHGEFLMGANLYLSLQWMLSVCAYN